MLQEKLRKKGKIRKIIVDREKCIGARSCVVVAPGVFQVDKEDKVYLVDPDSTADDLILLAAQSCPVNAIRLLDENDRAIFLK